MPKGLYRDVIKSFTSKVEEIMSVPTNYWPSTVVSTLIVVCHWRKTMPDSIRNFCSADPAGQVEFTFEISVRMRL